MIDAVVRVDAIASTQMPSDTLFTVSAAASTRMPSDTKGVASPKFRGRGYKIHTTIF